MLLLFSFSRNHNRWRRIASVLPAFLALGGGGAAVASPQKKPAQKPPVKPTAPATDPSLVLPKPAGDAATYLASLKSQPNGKGILIFSPVMTRADASPDFSTGCARWLYLALASAPDLPQMPLWYLPNSLQDTLGRDNLRLTAAEASKAIDLMPTTHYAVGTAQPGKLSFQVYAFATKQPVGEPVSISGTDTQITAALPTLANGIRARLGLTPFIIAPPTESAAELSLLGHLPIYPTYHISADEIKALRPVATHSVLASLMYLFTVSLLEKDPELLPTRMRSLLIAGGDNPIVLAELARTSSDSAVQEHVHKLAPLYPRSVAIAVALSYIEVQRAARIAILERAVRLTYPPNAEIWYLLATEVGYSGNDLRRARTVDKISSAEWEQLHKIYARWLAVAVQAASLNSRNNVIYEELAEAATFAGEQETAYRAIDRAFELSKTARGAPAIVEWALQMYAPKWGGSPELIQKAAERAARLPIVDVRQSVTVMKTLAPDHPAQADQVAQAILQYTEAPLKANPDDVIFCSARRNALVHLKRHTEALELSRHYVSLRPDNPDGHRALMEDYRTLGRLDEAITEGQRILKDFPRDITLRMDLGLMLSQRQRWPEAIQVAREVIALAPERGDAHAMLGYMLFSTEKYTEAIPYFETAFRLQPSSDTFPFYLGMACCRLGRVSEGRRWLLESRRLTQSPQRVKQIDEALKEYKAQ